MDNGFVCVCSVSTKMPVMGNVRTVSTYMCKHLHLIVREYMNVFFLVQVCAFVSMNVCVAVDAVTGDFAAGIGDFAAVEVNPTHVLRSEEQRRRK